MPCIHEPSLDGCEPVLSWSSWDFTFIDSIVIVWRLRTIPLTWGGVMVSSPCLVSSGVCVGCVRNLYLLVGVYTIHSVGLFTLFLVVIVPSVGG